jgi:hypothetical protein
MGASRTGVRNPKRAANALARPKAVFIAALHGLRLSRNQLIA